MDVGMNNHAKRIVYPSILGGHDVCGWRSDVVSNG